MVVARSVAFLMRKERKEFSSLSILNFYLQDAKVVLNAALDPIGNYASRANIIYITLRLLWCFTWYQHVSILTLFSLFFKPVRTLSPSFFSTVHSKTGNAMRTPRNEAFSVDPAQHQLSTVILTFFSRSGITSSSFLPFNAGSSFMASSIILNAL